MPHETAFQVTPISYNIGGQEFVVRPLALKPLKEVIRIVAEAFAEYGKLGQKPGNEILTALPELLISRFHLLAPIVLGPTATQEFLDNNVTLPQVIQIIKDLVEMNQIMDFFNLLNPQARAQATTEKAPGSTSA